MHFQRKTLTSRRAMARRCLLLWAVGAAVLVAIWAAGAPGAVMVAWTVTYAILAVAVR